MNYTHLRTSSPVVSYQYSPADVRIFRYSSEIVLEILQNKKMTEAMMTGKHVESSAEEITQPSKMDKNMLLSRSQNWYVSVGVVENSLKYNVGLVSSHGHRRLHSLTVPPTRANRDTHAFSL